MGPGKTRRTFMKDCSTSAAALATLATTAGGGEMAAGTPFICVTCGTQFTESARPPDHCAICDEAGVPHPTIISESGRAVVAYHSALVFGVLGVAGLVDPLLDRYLGWLLGEVERAGVSIEVGRPATPLSAAGCRGRGGRSMRAASWFCREVSTAMPISSNCRPQASSTPIRSRALPSRLPSAAPPP